MSFDFVPTKSSYHKSVCFILDHDTNLSVDLTKIIYVGTAEMTDDKMVILTLSTQCEWVGLGLGICDAVKYCKCVACTILLHF